jgi:hypothetical protein
MNHVAVDERQKARIVYALVPFCKYCGNLSLVPCKGCEEKFNAAVADASEAENKELMLDDYETAFFMRSK